MSPGPWWLKPLWSLRQQVEVSRMLSEATGARQGSSSQRLEPLRVLHRHRGGDHGERLVGGEQAVAPGEQVALEPALAEVLAEHLHHPAVRATRDRRSATGAPRGTGSRPRRPRRGGCEFVSSGQKSRKFACRVGAVDVAQQLAERTRRLALLGPGRVDRQRVRREVGEVERRRAGGRRWRAGWRPCAVALGAARPARGTSRPSSSKSSSGR